MDNPTNNTTTTSFWQRCISKFLAFWHIEMFAGYKLGLLLIALSLHLGTFALLNFGLQDKIDRAYNSITLDPQSDFTVWEGSKKTIRWKVEGLRNWVMQDVEGFSENNPMPAVKLIQGMFATIKTPDVQIKERQRRLKDLITGKMSNKFGIPCSWVNVEYTPAERVFDEMANVGGGDWRKIFENDKYTEEKRALIIHCIRMVQNQVNDEIRFMKRFSDSIQWLTILVSWILLCHLLSRYRHIQKVNRLCHKQDWYKAMFQYLHLMSYTPYQRFAAPTPPTPEMLEQARDIVENKIYNSYQFFLNTIPSLGFIGTVLGMGKALLKSDLLFGAQNLQERQQAISNITLELGFAFDTTFVALVAGIIVGAVFLACQRLEWQVMFKVTEQYKESKKNIH